MHGSGYGVSIVNISKIKCRYHPNPYGEAILGKILKNTIRRTGMPHVSVQKRDNKSCGLCASLSTLSAIG